MENREGKETKRVEETEKKKNLSNHHQNKTLPNI